MDRVILPPQVNYTEQLPSLLPSTQNFTQVLQPVNGSSFTQNSQIFIDIPSRGFVDPKSIYLRYKAVATTTTQGGVVGCPVYTPFVRLDTFVNSQMIESVQDWNVACHAWSNLYLGVNEKYGAQSAFGYAEAVPGVVTLDELDGRLLGSATGETYYVSAPLVQCMLSNCDKFIPAFATGGIRLVFTLDSNANMFTSAAGASTMTISNFEVVYDMIDFGPEVEQAVLSSPMISIKSTGVSNSGVNVAAGSVGNNQIVFNARFQSIRNAILLPSGTAPGAVTINGKLDAIDITNGGTYSLTVGGNVFPQGAPLNAGTNKSGILQELRKATGSLYDWSKSMAINSAEFGYTDAAATTSLTQPGKFYCGIDLNKINSGSNMLLNGVSSVNSPINANLNIASATARGYNLYLLLQYDCVLNIDPRSRTLSVLQ